MYYDRRAAEYEEIYHRDDPARQREIAAIAAAMRNALDGRLVLEVACGTGYWTGMAAEVARHVVAVDSSPAMLALAHEKGLPKEKVEFRQGDAYGLEPVEGIFNAGLANFWLSHVPKARLAEFLQGFHSKLEKGSTVFMADNLYVHGLGGDLVNEPGSEDTFKERKLSDGSVHKVLKNYYEAGDLRSILQPLSSGLHIEMGECFWWVRYQVA